MKRLILILLLFVPMLTNAQVQHLKEYVCSNGYKIRKGDSVATGVGTVGNGDFKHIVAYPRKFKDNYLPPTEAGKRLAVKKMYKNLFTGKVIVFVYADSGDVYECDIEGALASGEIRAPEKFYNFKVNPYLPDIEYKGEIKTGLNNQELMKKVEQWFKGIFTDPLSRITKADVDQGLFEGVNVFFYRSNINYGNANTKGYIQYNMVLKVTNGTCHYEFGNFVHAALPYNQAPISFGELTEDKDCPDDKANNGNGKKWSQSVWNELKQAAMKKAETLADSLKTTILGTN